MRRSFDPLAVVALLALAPLQLACTDAASESAGAGGAGHQPNVIEGDWQTLVDAGWQLAPGTEDYWCARKTVTEEIYIRAFRALAPPGTHHTVLTRTDGSQPDGEFGCGPGTLDDEMLYASGVGTDDFGFPDGVAIRVAAGTQLLLNLHLFNTGTAPIDGVSGTQVLTAPAAEVDQLAEMLFAGTPLIVLPPQSERVINGYCSFDHDSTVVAVWPHMHQYGTHMKVVHQSASQGDLVLHDAPYRFAEQVNYPIEPHLIPVGEQVRVHCSYENPTSATITFGDSSDDEMCFAGLYRFPASGQSLFCDSPL